MNAAQLPAPSPRSAAAAAPSLAPREHGAYGQLALPLVTALAAGRPTVAAVAFTAAAGFAFALHEPLLVLLGQRGPRALRASGARAKTLLTWLGAAAVASGALGVATAPLAATAALAAPVVLAVALAWTIAKKREHTTVGECLAGAAFASIGLPVAVASGVALSSAVALALAWGAVFALSTLAVRHVIASHKRAPGARVLRAAGAAALALPFAALAAVHAPPIFFAAPVPVALLAAVLVARPPHPRKLRAVGWTIVAASVATLALFVVAARVVA